MSVGPHCSITIIILKFFTGKLLLYIQAAKPFNFRIGRELYCVIKLYLAAYLLRVKSQVEKGHQNLSNSRLSSRAYNIPITPQKRNSLLIVPKAQDKVCLCIVNYTPRYCIISAVASSIQFCGSITQKDLQMGLIDIH